MHWRMDSQRQARRAHRPVGSVHAAVSARSRLIRRDHVASTLPVRPQAEDKPAVIEADNLEPAQVEELPAPAAAEEVPAGETEQAEPEAPAASEDAPAPAAEASQAAE